MTPQEAVKFKEQIAYFIEHPEDGMLYRVEDSWDETKYPKWLIDNEYVIPDKYQEFRMALTDGKEIQFYDKYYEDDLSKQKWYSINKINKFIELKYYRTKPEEPKLNIGDWINIVRNNGVIFSTRKFNHQDSEFSPPNGYIYKLWKPKPGEWVACSDDKFKYTIKKFEYQDTARFIKVEPLEAIALLKKK